MYLSKLQLHIGSPSVRQALKDCNDMHRNIMRAFDTDRQQAGVLYRLVEGKDEITLYVLSHVEAQWQRIEAMGYKLLRMQDISPLCSKYGDHALLHFSLLCCPTKKKPGEGKNSKRVLLTDYQERMAWLTRQGVKNGFAVLEAHETGEQARLAGKKSTGDFYLTGVLFEGVLKITDQQLFWQGYQQGIGQEKAYGMGLMMLSRG